MSTHDEVDGAPSPAESSFASPAPTFASFSPVTLSANTPSRSSRTSTVLVHQKSPLLLATPPQITRALAYSHPFLLPLNTFVGLLTWSSGDPWQSFLLLCSFWAVALYGDVVLLRAGPVAVGIALIVAMYGRRYSPLSSSGWRDPAKNNKSKGKNTNAQFSASGKADTNGPPSDYPAKHRKTKSELTGTKHQKTLDEIVETLKEFTGRCNALMEPLLEMTDFLSTQRTATSATTKPALIAMFMRLLIITPFWFALTMPPLRVITVRRVVLVIGTVILTWHCRVTRVSRTILWRSSLIRKLSAAVTGLRFDTPVKSPADAQLLAARKGHKRTGSSRVSKSSGVKFTFIIYENQRRWIGLGWTHSLFAYERAAWTDEHNNATPSKEDFELPHVEDGSRMEWQWAEGSRWRVDGVPDDHGPVEYDGDEGRNGWVYYDNKVCETLLPFTQSSFANTVGKTSGITDAAAKTAGVNGQDEENGTAMQSSSRWTLPSARLRRRTLPRYTANPTRRLSMSRLLWKSLLATTLVSRLLTMRPLCTLRRPSLRFGRLC